MVKQFIGGEKPENMKQNYREGVSSERKKQFTWRKSQVEKIDKNCNSGSLELGP